MIMRINSELKGQTFEAVKIGLDAKKHHCD